MLVTVAGISISFNEEQPLNKFRGISVIFGGKFALTTFLQPSKAAQPIEVTKGGMTILVNVVQLLKASYPIEVTFSGISTSARL